MSSLNRTSAHQLPDVILKRLGHPTSAFHALTWEGLGGEAVIFARSARGWDGVARRLDAVLPNCNPAAVVAATGSGIRSLRERADLQELLRICDAPRVRRIVVSDASRIARDSNVLLEVLDELWELGVSVEAAGQPLTAHAASLSDAVTPPPKR